MRLPTMRLRLSDVASFAVLAEHYQAQAEMCRQMALMTVGPFKDAWLELAAEWTNLAREAEAKPETKRQAEANKRRERRPEAIRR